MLNNLNYFWNLDIFAIMNIIEIDDIKSSKVSDYTQLTEAQLRNRLEPEKGIFIAESLKVVRIALQKGIVPLSFLSEKKYIDSQLETLYDNYCIGDDVPIFTGERDVLAGITGYELSRGFLCAMRRPQQPTVTEICTGKRRIAVMDNVVNSTNTGAIFRAATALGIDGLLLTPTCCDPLNRRSVRVSMGTVFQLQWSYIDSTAGMHWTKILSTMGYKTVALALSDKAVDIDCPELKREKKLAIIMGTEGDGLSHDTIDQCDYVAKIPMQRGVDSLNVAAAASVAFWELRAN